MTQPQPGPAPTPPPVCPRHPDRIAYVRCQRCGRPACPECQRPAAVGIQCVDCVREGQRAQRPARTAFGGRVAGGRPVVTLTLIGLCVASYVLQQVSDRWTIDLAFVPFLGETEPWRFLTSAFLHSPSSLFHILFNMVALWSVGPFLEASFGRWRFLALYLLSAIGGSVMFLLLATPYSASWFTVLVGASGAVFGLFGAVLVVLRRVGRSAGGIVGVLLINAVLGFVLPGVAWQAHLGGLVVGAALGAAFAYAPRERRTVVAVGSCVAVAVLLVGAALVTYAGV
ncbi:rhomboid family intramembrane serine protease [Cellulomonas hominis]|uniref:Rhomboid family intramembrane serine protease n=1 Tax=Cellulomonas hominis TaxID=156981 RepID=A0A7Z8K2I7_9CELL|nr:rhomboid family intramembrane serine protease [Cellulomonas hominis]